MTLQNLLDFAYEYCRGYGLYNECNELSELTATWKYQDHKNDQIEDLMSADTVKVVRCKDCIYFHHCDDDRGICNHCNEDGSNVFEFGFCYYGKSGGAE